MDIYGGNGSPEIPEIPEPATQIYGYAVDEKVLPLNIDLSTQSIIQFVTESTTKTENNTILSVSGFGVFETGLYSITATLIYNPFYIITGLSFDVTFNLSDFTSGVVYTEHTDKCVTNEKKTVTLTTITNLDINDIVCIRGLSTSTLWGSVHIFRHELTVVRIY